MSSPPSPPPPPISYRISFPQGFAWLQIKTVMLSGSWEAKLLLHCWMQTMLFKSCRRSYKNYSDVKGMLHLRKDSREIFHFFMRARLKLNKVKEPVLIYCDVSSFWEETEETAHQNSVDSCARDFVYVFVKTHFCKRKWGKFPTNEPCVMTSHVSVI